MHNPNPPPSYHVKTLEFIEMVNPTPPPSYHVPLNIIDKR